MKLDELEKRARLAMPDMNGKYYVLSDSSTVIALVKVCRAAKAYHDFPHYGTERDFKESLQEIAE